MSRVALLGDSIFDNAAYVRPGQDVAAHLARELDPSWKVSLVARDGAVTTDIPVQAGRVPRDATHLVLSVGGNDALMAQGVILYAEGRESCLDALAETREVFERNYRRALDAATALERRLFVCTVYLPFFSDPLRRRVGKAGLAIFNDVITWAAFERRLPIIDLRQICTEPGHFSHEIEPSEEGGRRIARAIAEALEKAG